MDLRQQVTSRSLVMTTRVVLAKILTQPITEITVTGITVRWHFPQLNSSSDTLWHHLIPFKTQHVLNTDSIGGVASPLILVREQVFSIWSGNVDSCSGHHIQAQHKQPNDHQHAAERNEP